MIKMRLTTVLLAALSAYWGPDIPSGWVEWSQVSMVFHWVQRNPHFGFYVVTNIKLEVLRALFCRLALYIGYKLREGYWSDWPVSAWHVFISKSIIVDSEKRFSHFQENPWSILRVRAFLHPLGDPEQRRWKCCLPPLCQSCPYQENKIITAYLLWRWKSYGLLVLGALGELILMTLTSA